MLVPLLAGGFVVLVDTSLAERAAAAPAGSALIRQVLAHELAHSFFYAAGSPPERLLPLEAQEEIFCDAFALQILKRQVGAA